MFSHDERTRRIGKIRQLPALLESAVAGLNDTMLNTPVGPGKWTVRQIVHHIADANLNAFVRMKLVLTEDKPILKPFKQDAWATLSDSTGAPVQSSLALLRGLHERWTALLESVPEDAWKREGIHLERGKVTLEDLLDTYSRHGESHAAQITKMRSLQNLT